MMKNFTLNPSCSLECDVPIFLASSLTFLCLLDVFLPRLQGVKAEVVNG